MAQRVFRRREVDFASLPVCSAHIGGGWLSTRIAGWWSRTGGAVAHSRLVCPVWPNVPFSARFKEPRAKLIIRARGCAGGAGWDCSQLGGICLFFLFALGLSRADLCWDGTRRKSMRPDMTPHCPSRVCWLVGAVRLFLWLTQVACVMGGPMLVNNHVTAHFHGIRGLASGHAG